MEHFEGIYQCSWCLYEENDMGIIVAGDLEEYLKLCLAEAKMGRVKRVEL